MGAGRVIPHPDRRKGGAPLLGARHPGEQGPFGGRPDEEDLDDQPDDFDEPS